MIKETLLSLAMQCATSVHPDTVHDIAKVESGFNPYAIAEIKAKGKVVSHLPKTKEEALNVISQLKAANARYSVGLMQIYSGNFKGFDVTPEELLDSCRNLNIFEKILVDCYQRGGDIVNALSCYYSGNFKTGKKKESQFANTSYIERIGVSENKNNYIVPSTKLNKGGSDSKEKIISENNINQTQSLNKIVYPRYAMRGITKEN
ncbi:lytic transglycosylase domain-containing protein [Providencia rustigianii]|uniref:Transglycosylase SLT domain protein n=1 Tax=Providencia rustigianii DSM 4541 TaxID=500637 RepID=D1P802_9GAMM|nr:lytic transglycosylase domain-containing protein [Providencia rustigianii]EFB70445.1 transglycosylase SLT domain protein [Providencia rustigianii DSM 4541]